MNSSFMHIVGQSGHDSSHFLLHLCVPMFISIRIVMEFGSQLGAVPGASIVLAAMMIIGFG